jgi:crotonobetainyl-CoA:carnitine CoA-transferase CaiB-like acyl-CoA transferase
MGTVKKCNLLDSFTALDLSNETGFLCGKILADFGADVIKVERPNGDSSRNIGPFYKDEAHPEKSLHWFFYNANKRGITLNIETDNGKEIFKRLVKKSDFIIETFPPGYLDSLELNYPVLCEINPKIILVSITPFGQDGPYRDYIADDLCLMALGGSLYINGEPDREPVNYSFPLSWGHAGAEAAAATMISFYQRQSTGKGQHIDVSIQECITQTLHNVVHLADLQKRDQNRTGIYYRMKPEAQGGSQAIWKCKDGYVCYVIFGGRLGGRSNRPLIEWMASEMELPLFIKEIEWEELDMAAPPKELLDALSEYFKRFFASHTKKEIYEEAIKRRIFLCPVNDPSDIMASPQLKYRGFWERLEHSELGTEITYPGAFIKMSQTPLKLYRRAPLIGEHNEEV